MRLSDVAIRRAKASDKPFKLTDGFGLHLLVKPSGKYWRHSYRFGGKQKTMALGVYPEVSLKKAREKLWDARRLLDQGIDPGEFRKAQKLAENDNRAGFEGLAREWFAKFSPTWAESHAKRNLRRLERDVFPWIGARPIESLEAPELLTVLRRIENRGTVETAHRVKHLCGQIFRYAIAIGKVSRNPVSDLQGALPPVRQNHFAAITDPRKIGQLLRDIDEFKGSFVTKCALRLAPYVFVRPFNLRAAEWNEINFETKEWKIPEGKMKMRGLHIVPLAHQSLAILEEIRPLTHPQSRYVFPGERTAERSMSENTLLAALRRLGYTKEEMTPHGFRAMASTLLHEQGWSTDIIERQLAHKERNKVKAAYNHAQYLPQRREMMQAWADYLDGLHERVTHP